MRFPPATIFRQLDPYGLLSRLQAEGFGFRAQGLWFSLCVFFGPSVYGSVCGWVCVCVFFFLGGGKGGGVVVGSLGVQQPFIT